MELSSQEVIPLQNGVPLELLWDILSHLTLDMLLLGMKIVENRNIEVCIFFLFILS